MKWPRSADPAATLVIHPPDWNKLAYPSTTNDSSSTALYRSVGIEDEDDGTGACGFSGGLPSAFRVEFPVATGTPGGAAAASAPCWPLL